MKLRIKYFASVRERFGIEQEIVDIDAPELTVDALRAHIASRDERAAKALHTDVLIRAAVNQEMVDGGFVVRGDSEIAFFPPVTGG